MNLHRDDRNRLRRLAIGGALLALVAAGLACSLPVRPPEAEGTGETPIATAVTANTPTPPPALPTEVPTNTPTATLTPTSTLGPPVFTTTTNANCRTGPGLVYDIVRVVMAGTTEPIVGKDVTGTWWVIQGGVRCWISNVTGTASGDLSGVPVIPAPPTPTPSPTATITPTATLHLIFPTPIIRTIVPLPIPRVSAASIAVDPTTCVYVCSLTFSGTITATGPLTAEYEWQRKFDDGPWSTFDRRSLTFSGPGTLNTPVLHRWESSGPTGVFTYRLHVTSPNSVYSNEVPVLYRYP